MVGQFLQDLAGEFRLFWRWDDKPFGAQLQLLTSPSVVGGLRAQSYLVLDALCPANLYPINATDATNETGAINVIIETRVAVKCGPEPAQSRDAQDTTIPRAFLTKQGWTIFAFHSSC